MDRDGVAGLQGFGVLATHPPLKSYSVRISLPPTCAILVVVFFIKFPFRWSCLSAADNAYVRATFGIDHYQHMALVGTPDVNIPLFIDDEKVPGTIISANPRIIPRGRGEISAGGTELGPWSFTGPLPLPTGQPSRSSNARVERAQFHRARSASKKGTWPLSPHPSEAARCASTEDHQAPSPPFVRQNRIAGQN